MTAPRAASSPAVRPRRAPLSGPPDVPVDTVVAARRGDPAAFARIVEHWDAHLRPFVHHALGGDGSTDRVLAAAYVRAYRALPRYRGELTPGLWLHRIAYLSATDELRRLSRERARHRRRTEELMAEAGASTDAGPTPEADPSLDDPDLWAVDDVPVEDPPDPTRIVARPIPPEPDEPLEPPPPAHDDAAPPGWHALAADQRALAVLVDVEGFTAEAAADAFDTTPRIVFDRIGSARRVLARAGAQDASGGRAIAVAVVEAPSPLPVSSGRDRPGAVGGAAIGRVATDVDPNIDAGDADAGADSDAPEPSEWTTVPGDEIEEVRLVADEPAPAVAANDAARADAEEGLGGAEDLTVDLIASSRAVLVDLAVPPPGERFWADLGRRLLAERESPAAPAIDPLARLARAHPAEPGFHPKDKRKLHRPRGAAESDVPTPAVTSLADQAEWVRPRRAWKPVLGGIALLAIVAGLVYIAVHIGTSERIPDGTIAGSDLATDVSAALNEGPYTQVELAVDEPDPTGNDTATHRFRVIVGADGSWLFSSLDRIDQTTYDASSGTQRRVAVVGDGDDQSVEAFERRGLAGGSPDAGPTPPDPLVDLQAVLPLLRSAGNTRVQATRSGARTTWTLVRSIPSGSGGTPETWRVVIGRDDDLPLVVERRNADGVVRRTRLSGWQIRQVVPADTFAQTVPEGAEETNRDAAFETTDLDEAPGLGTEPPVTPGWLPAGYELTSVTVRSEAPAGAASTAGGRNPKDRQVVSLAFRRGLSTITVTTRAAGPNRADWRDPLEVGPSTALRPTTRTLSDGRFNGLDVTIASDAVGRAHLWGVTDPETATDGGTVLTVSGDLTPAQAFRIAASLR